MTVIRNKFNWYSSNSPVIKEGGVKEKLPYWIIWALVSIMSISGLDSGIKRVQKYNEIKDKLNAEQKQMLDENLRNQELMAQLKSLYLEKTPAPTPEQSQINPKPVPQPAKPVPTQTQPVNQKTKQKSLTKEQKKIVDAVARTIWGEARGESWEGQLAVASTIWNRANGNTNRLDDVVKQRKQYSIWNSGVPEKGGGEEWKKVIALAEQMVTNQFKPSVPYTHYFNPDVASPNWAYENGKLVRDHKIIGNHVFLNP